MLTMSHLYALLMLICMAPHFQGHMMHDVKPKLLIISFSGLRHDYIDLAEKKGYNVSIFRYLMNNGATADKVVNVYPTSLIPNFFTISTGLYPESHGYVDSAFYDPTLKAKFNWLNQSDLINPKWLTEGVEPLWKTNQRMGRKSSSFYWPGTATPINNLFVTHQFGISSLQEMPPLDYRIDRLLAWLADDDESTLGFIFYPQPCIIAEKTGPESPEVFSMIDRLNFGLGYLLERIVNSEDFEHLNVLIVGDHGLTATDADKIIVLDKLVYDDLITIVKEPTRWHIWPKTGKLDDVHTLLKKNNYPNLKIYKKSEIPAVWNFRNNSRIPPILVIANLGWRIAADDKEKKAMAAIKASYGYPTLDQPDNMSPFVVGWGPGFQRGGARIPELHLVDICPLVCELLGLGHRLPTNGSLARVKPWLKRSGGHQDAYFSGTMVTYLTVIGGCGLVASILSLAAIFQSTVYYRRYGNRGRAGSSGSHQYRRHHRDGGDLGAGEDPRSSATAELLAQDGLDDVDL